MRADHWRWFGDYGLTIRRFPEARAPDRWRITFRDRDGIVRSVWSHDVEQAVKESRQRYFTGMAV